MAIRLEELALAGAGPVAQEPQTNASLSGLAEQPSPGSSTAPDVACVRAPASRATPGPQGG